MNDRIHGKITTRHKVIKNGQPIKSLSYKQTGQAEDATAISIAKDFFAALFGKQDTGATKSPKPSSTTKPASINKNPEIGARCIVQQSDPPRTKFVVTNGRLYVQKNLAGLFSGKYEEHDLESTPIIHDQRSSAITIESYGQKITFNGLGGIDLELATAMRLERAAAYPNSRRTQEDRRNFPNIRWSDVDEGPGGMS